jgi:hypothetical protein
MASLLETTQQIFDVARSGMDWSGWEGADDAECQDFALLIGRDGALHFVMESPFSIEAAAIHTGAQSAYRITHSRHSVRVQGRSGGKDCVLEERTARRELLRDQPLYRITSPLLSSGSV